MASTSSAAGTAQASSQQHEPYVCAPLADGKRKWRVTVLISGSGSNLAAIMTALTNKLERCSIVQVISNSKDAYGLERARQSQIPCLSFSPFQFQKSGPDLFERDEQDIKRLGERIKQMETGAQVDQDDVKELKNEWLNKKRNLTQRVKPLYQLELANKVKQTKPDLIVLAGFMLILLPETLERLKRDWIEEDDDETSGIQAQGTITTRGKTPYEKKLEIGTAIPIINLHPALPGSFVGPHVIEDAWEAFNQVKLPATKEEWERMQQNERRSGSPRHEEDGERSAVEQVAESLASARLDREHDGDTPTQQQQTTTTTTDPTRSAFGPLITETGIMIHRVIPELDRGEPILWRRVPMQQGEWIDDLKTRIHEVEHEAIVEAVRVVTDDMLADGSWWKGENEREND
ncbi:hypothetical protein ACM66B_006327 [Microbotryomycetes sp. NB124-2]